MGRLVLIPCLLAFVCLCQGQDPANAQDRERGILFSTTSNSTDKVHLIHMSINPGDPIKRPGMTHGWQFTLPELTFTSLDVDYRDSVLYLYEESSKSILALTSYRAPVTDGPYEGFIYYLNIGISSGAVQLAYDYLSKTLYWTDSALGFIGATSGNMTKLENTSFVDFGLYYKAVKQLQHPEALGVDPPNGLMFYSDNGASGKIERANLDGSMRHTMIDTDTEAPHAIDLDTIDRRVYWVDWFKEAIEYMDYYGTKVNRLDLRAGVLWSDLALFKNVVTAVENRFGRAYFLDKTTGEEKEDYLEFKSDYLYGVLIYNIENQPLKTYTGSSCVELQCDHLCISMATNPKCVCYEGYDLDTDGKTCLEAEGNTHKAIVIATQWNICLADIRALNDISPFFGLSCVFQTFQLTESTTPPTTSAPNVTTTTQAPYNPYTDPDNVITMIDLDNRKRTVYFATEAGTIYWRALDVGIDNFYREKVVSATGNISGLVYDWVNKNNLYYVDGTSKVLHRVDVRTRSNTVVGSVGTDNPSNLVMLYRQRRLAWWLRKDENTTSTYKLVTSDLNGGDLKTIVSDRKNVQSLAVDDEKEEFYWIEGENIESVSINNNDDSSAIVRVTSTTFDGYEILLQYRNLLMWAYAFNGFGTYLQHYNMEDGSLGTPGQLDTYSLFRDMKVLDSDLIIEDLSDQNQCSYQNGGCQQSCIVKYTAGMSNPVKQCGCTLGYTLHSDGKRCVSSFVQTDFALVTDTTYGRIYQIDLENDKIYALNLRESSLYNSVMFHRLNKHVYWTEAANDFVYSAKLDSSEFKIRDKRASYSPGDFALDETTGHLYYVESNYPFDGHVRVLTPEGHGFRFIKNTLDYQDHISAIDAHPHKGWLYMAVRSGLSHSYILRSNLDGSNILRFSVSMIMSANYPTINGLVINHKTDKLYLTEGEEDKIYECDLYLQNCDTFYEDPSAGIQQIDTDGDNIYYTSYSNHHLMMVRIADKRVTILGKSVNLGKLESLSVYKHDTKNIQKKSAPCEDRNGRGDCSTVCFPTETGRTCACEGDVKLKADKRTCENVFQCNSSFMDTSANQNIQVAPECLRYVNESCYYVCPDKQRPVNTMMITCTLNGWDKQSQLCQSSSCPQAIPNGRVASNCGYNVGRPCNFLCNDNMGYYPHPDVKSLTCKTDGTWDSNGKTACTNLLCPTTITDGTIDGRCDRRLGSSCGFTCRKNFYKTNTVQSVVCQLRNGRAMWSQVDNLCSEIMCPANVGNGVVDSTCSKTVGSSCTFTCPAQFKKSTTVTTIMCTPSGVWDKSEDLCIPPLPGVSSASTGSDDKKVSIGLGVGFAIVAIFALILLAILCRGRLANCGRGGKDLPSARFANDTISLPESSYGIENPGYLTANVPVTNDGGYDQASAAKNPNYSQDNTYNTINDNGTVKSGQSFYYGNETLPEKKEIESPKGTGSGGSGVYVAADEWLKDQQPNNGRY